MNVIISNVSLFNQHIVRPCFFIYSLTVHLLIGEFKPFIFEIVSDGRQPHIAILFIVFCMLYSYFVPLFLSCCVPLCIIDFFVMTYFESFLIFFCTSFIGTFFLVTMGELYIL